jgi:methylated-DNA-[protein]-cysteine S-methyltransferase
MIVIIYGYVLRLSVTRLVSSVGCAGNADGHLTKPKRAAQPQPIGENHVFINRVKMSKDMDTQIKYTVFETKWGYFGLAGDEKGLIRTVLPCPHRKTVEKNLLAGLKQPQYDKYLLKPLQKQIIAYFAGKHPVRFLPSNFCLLTLSQLSSFTRKVLTACGKIPPGQTVSYSQLAGMIGKPRASRAVGSALAKNPIPLIIPCHRVIHRDGTLGKFSAEGGTDTKKKLLALEKE